MFVEHKEVGEVKELDAGSKLILSAADWIERNGWCQNKATDGQRLCAVGGLRMAIHGSTDFVIEDIKPGVRDAVTRLREAMDGSISGWNDQPGRTKEEVVAKLRAVALGG